MDTYFCQVCYNTVFVFLSCMYSQTLTLEKKELGAQAIQASTVEEAAQVINASKYASRGNV